MIQRVPALARWVLGLALGIAGALTALVTLGSSLQAQAPAPAPDQMIYKDPTQPEAARLDDLMKRLTIDEKIGLMSGNNSYGTTGATMAIPRLGIPAMLMNDGPLGVRDGRMTVLPGGPLTAATFDPTCMQMDGTVIGEDLVADPKGQFVLLGPGLNIHRTPVCGRNGEYFSEDPYLAGVAAANYVKGVQGAGAAATIKHFDCNNQENNRGGINVRVSDRALREIYLPAFKAAVQQGGALCVMSSYNLVNGFHSSENNYLLNEVLKKEWGFQGLVMSDWGGVHSALGPMIGGNDLEMPNGANVNQRTIPPLLASNQLTMAQIDDHVRRILRVELRLGLLDGPDAIAKKRLPASTISDTEHLKMVREIAEKGIVLLKNDAVPGAAGAAGMPVLPIDRTKVKTIAVIGQIAQNMPGTIGGSGSVSPKVPLTTPLVGLKALAGPNVSVNYASGMGGSATAVTDAAALAAKADVAVVCVGLNGGQDEGEGGDRRSMALPRNQDALVSAIFAANPRTVVVLFSGGMLTPGDWVIKVPAILYAYYPGNDGGTALAEILYGDVNPSGRMPDTMGKSRQDYSDNATYPQGTYNDDIYVGYRWFDKNKIEPIFCFGHGLSYTTFKYSNLQFTPVQTGTAGVSPVPSPETLQADGTMTVSVDVQNTGTVAGEEVVQLYVHDPQPHVNKAPQELKGFTRVSLKPGETKTATMTLDPRALAYVDEVGKQWKADAGEYEIRIGASSRDIRQTGTIKLAHDWTEAVPGMQNFYTPPAQ